MIQATTLLQQTTNNTPGWDTPSRSPHEIKQWCLLITLSMVGMLLLPVCFLLQGVFATVGPWVIFAGAKLIAGKVEQTTIGRTVEVDSQRLLTRVGLPALQVVLPNDLFCANCCDKLSNTLSIEEYRLVRVVNEGVKRDEKNPHTMKPLSLR